MEHDIRPSISEERRAAFDGRAGGRIAEPSRPLASLSDDDLLRRLTEIHAQSRRVETDLVAHMAEVEGRRLFAREAFPSMFAYCTKALHLSEAEAYLRIAAARASREHPIILAMLGDGRLHRPESPCWRLISPRRTARPFSAGRRTGRSGRSRS